MKVLIVGGVAVGATAAARLRRLSEKTDIVLFEKGAHISFANCGLPYYVGGIIEDRDKLLMQSPQGMKDWFNIDVRIQTEVVAIDTSKKQIVAQPNNGLPSYTESYDYLILSPGAIPIIPPIEGMTAAKHMFTLRNMADADRIHDFIHKNQPKQAVVIGGGFIGLEMAENLVEKGIEVSLIEMSPQVMPNMDFEITQYIHQALNANGINLYLSNGLHSIENEGNTIILQNGVRLKSDLTILAIGVRPDTYLSERAGLEKGKLGGILVNENLQTSDPFIYAGGDAIEVMCFVAKKPTRVPLAWPANRQAKLIADHIMGLHKSYSGSLGTGIIKIFDYAAASTGLSENQLKKHGNIQYKVALIHPNQHASYYPGAAHLTLKLIFEANSGKILGAQAFGKFGVDKRIDVIATAIKAGFTVYDLQELQLAYAPPFGSAKDPINMLGYVGANVLEGQLSLVQWQDVIGVNDETRVLLDVRTEKEYLAGHMPNAVHFPLETMRQNLGKLQKNNMYWLVCGVGQRAYYGSKILKNNGFKNVKVVIGGYELYKIASGNYAKTNTPNC